MHRSLSVLLALILSTTAINVQSAFAETSAQPKEWTFLIYLNGNNNLDSFGSLNINQMEKVGSSDKVNIVVEWASMARGTVQRMLIKKDNDTTNVTSPVIQDMGAVDMGDYKSVIDFVKWGSEKFPAKHYLVDIWDHGSGWHDKDIHHTVKGISWDEISGNHITTKQLALALNASSKILGQKIDLYASDACLMAMAELADEVSDSVGVYAGSEETEPGEGWPYDAILTRWNALPKASARDVATILSEEYAKSYQSGDNKVTFSAFDLSALPAFNAALKTFADTFKGLSAAELTKLKAAATKSQHFEVSDYVDFVDFIGNVKSAKISKLGKSVLSGIGDSTKNFIVSSNAAHYPNAHGVSIWIPTDTDTYSQFSAEYSQMNFDHDTHWGDVAKAIANAKGPAPSN